MSLEDINEQLNGGSAGGEQAGGDTGLDALVNDLNGDGEEQTQDEKEAEAALLAGYQSAQTGGNAQDTGATGKKSGSDTGDEDDTTTGATVDDDQLQKPAPNADEEFRRGIDARFQTLEKSAASANGLAGYLKQQLASMGKGKTITKEHLPRVRQEFGDEYADAIAADLTAAGLGGAQISDAQINTMVSDRVGAVKETLEREMHFERVLEVHDDASDYFRDAKGVAGPQYGAFVAWIGTLPQARQEEIGNTWKSRIVSKYLTEFKQARDKAASAANRQKSRLNNSVVPTGGAAGGGSVPAEDPLVAGWNRAKGTQATARG